MPRPSPSLLSRVLAPLASLKLTVVLIVLAMILIYAGTWAQIDMGIWQVQKKYFHSHVVWVDFQTFLPRPEAGQPGVPGGFPMPGGYVIGLFLLLNLLAAHALRFKVTRWDLILLPLAVLLIVPLFLLDRGGAQWLIAWTNGLTNLLGHVKLEGYAALFTAGLLVGTVLAAPFLVALFVLHGKRSGVILIHLGLILLLVGEGVTSAAAVESQMVIDEGSKTNFAHDIRHAELAIVDPSPANHDDHMVIGDQLLRTGRTVKHSGLPVEVRVEEYFPNSTILGPMQAGDKKDARATAGSGVGVTVVGREQSSGTESEVDLPSAYVTLLHGGQSLGTYLASTMIEQPQTFEVNGKTYTLQLRFRRHYKPYTIELLDFNHDRYLGTDVPKDFSSHVRLVDPTRNVDREVRIWMNNPLRYHGETFYQSGFRPGDKTTILQVVKNPGWLMPYVACGIGALGMVVHFGIMLSAFIRKRLKPRAGTVAAAAAGKKSPDLVEVPPTPRVPWWSAPTLAGLALVALVYAAAVGYVMRPVGPKTAFDLKTFGTLPVSHEGRVQPLDSLARNSLKVISGKQTLKAEGVGKLSATRWLADVFAKPDAADDYAVFRVDHPEVAGLLGLDRDNRWFSLSQILTAREKLQEQFTRAEQVEAKQRDGFQRAIVELGQKLSLYFRLMQVESLFLIPPLAPGEKWQPLGDAVAAANQAGASNRAVTTYLSLIRDYNQDKPESFNNEVRAYAATVEQALPREMTKVHFEHRFSRFDPFLQCVVLYLLAFVLACLSWLFWGVHLRRAAIVAVLLALAVHTAGIVGRIYISGRPPVTNLESSAIFIGWGVVVLGVILELIYRNGIGSVLSSVIGFLGLAIYFSLAEGDTMKVLQAVLDTNFWLWTHVPSITIGYSATFLAGFLGIVYVIGGVFTRSLTKKGAKDLARMIYGVTCFAILFSFVGTILGGIWADQSWGRFWGWDPKENGAVLIVLANALLLHARWGGLAGDRGVACLAIFGNIVTSWSWFGTNMLGVGLHSYGFMDSALFWLLVFVASQVAIIVVANLPFFLWRSYPALFPQQDAAPVAGRNALPAV